MPEHGAVDEHFFVPAHKVADECAQGWMLEECPIIGRCMSDVEELEGLGFGRGANPLVEEGIVGGVEDTVTRGGVGFKYTGVGELAEIALDSMVSRIGVGMIHRSSSLSTVLAYRGRPLVERDS